jgi:hypothetical protein
MNAFSPIAVTFQMLRLLPGGSRIAATWDARRPAGPHRIGGVAVSPAGQTKTVKLPAPGTSYT